jgi:hypothetical protein
MSGAIESNPIILQSNGGVCRKCGRKLKNPLLTIGPICSKKIEKPVPEKVCDAAQQTL